MKVYALNNLVRIISGEPLGIADFRYRSDAYENAVQTERLRHVTCGKFIAYFERRPELIPDLMVVSHAMTPSKITVGMDVYLLAGICFDELQPLTKVGTLKRQSRHWVIEYIPGGEQALSQYRMSNPHRHNLATTQSASVSSACSASS